MPPPPARSNGFFISSVSLSSSPSYAEAAHSIGASAHHPLLIWPWYWPALDLSSFLALSIIKHSQREDIDAGSSRLRGRKEGCNGRQVFQASWHGERTLPSKVVVDTITLCESSSTRSNAKRHWRNAAWIRRRRVGFCGCHH